MSCSPLTVYQPIILQRLCLRQYLPNEYHDLYLSISNCFVPPEQHVLNEETIPKGLKLFFHRLGLQSGYPLLLSHPQLLVILFQPPKYPFHVSNNFEWFSLIILWILLISILLNPPLL